MSEGVGAAKSGYEIFRRLKFDVSHVKCSNNKEKIIMKANEINLNRFLGQNDTQFLFPVHQRNYDWTATLLNVI